MNIEDLREYCLEKRAVSESFPFDQSTLVFKVGSKMFALINIDKAKSVNLKNTPEKNLELREHYQGVHPGYHMSKKHWNTVDIVSDVPSLELKRLIDDSYDLVSKSLTKKEQISIGLL